MESAGSGWSLRVGGNVCGWTWIRLIVDRTVLARAGWLRATMAESLRAREHCSLLRECSQTMARAKRTPTPSRALFDTHTLSRTDTHAACVHTHTHSLSHKQTHNHTHARARTNTHIQKKRTLALASPCQAPSRWWWLQAGQHHDWAGGAPARGRRWWRHTGGRRHRRRGVAGAFLGWLFGCWSLIDWVGWFCSLG